MINVYEIKISGFSRAVLGPIEYKGEIEVYAGGVKIIKTISICQEKDQDLVKRINEIITQDIQQSLGSL